MEELLAFLPSLFQAGKGIGDLITGNQFGGAQRPVYNIPPEIAQATALARSQAQNPLLPGYGLAKNEIGGNTATTAHNIIESGGGAGTSGAFGNLSNNEAEQMRKLQLEGIAHQDKAIVGYGQALDTQAGYEDKAFDINKMQPYKYSQKAANTYTQGGLGEIFNSIKGGGQTYMLLDMLNKLKNPASVQTTGIPTPNVPPYSGGNSGGNNQTDNFYKSLFGGNTDDFYSSLIPQ